ncbi:cobalamin-binding protein, partial [Verrucosispora sp. SN26_14.1]
RALRAGPPPASLAHLADDEYAALVARRGELIDSALADLAHRHPAARDYTPAQTDSTVSDLGHVLDFLAAALYVDDDTLFTEFVEWMAAVLGSRGVPESAVDTVLSHYARVLQDFPRAAGYLRSGRAVVAARCARPAPAEA